MKIALLAALLASALSGCAIVPYGPRAYVQPAVVVAPAPAPVYYGAPGYYYGHGGGWGHGYRH
jgi:hypothetical protein